MKILFAASEAYPLVKTGGLGDVIYSLPAALQHQGMDVRVVLPAYRSLLEKLGDMRIAGWMDVQGAGRMHSVRILEAGEGQLGVPLLLVDVCPLFDRPGNPYLHPDGFNWPDNAERFAVFSRAVAQLAMDELNLGWKPDVVHTHDWQTGLVSALLSRYAAAPRTVFTIHNLAYSGMFSHDEYVSLQLPNEWWTHDIIEFFGNFSTLKAGVVFANRVTTVSPNYAREIRTPGYGYGLDGVLRVNEHKLSGIINGIDETVWNPQTDTHLVANYSLHHNHLAGKRANKSALLESFGVSDEQRLKAPLLGFVGRMVEQKGIDLLLAVIPGIVEGSDANFILLGTGDHAFEQALREMAGNHPGRVFLQIGYSEELAHRIEASADMFLMPSRFEPCGLNQLYSLRYGTPPIVTNTGGLADTVIDASRENIRAGTATGFVFNRPVPEELRGAIERSLEAFQKTRVWRQIVRTGMEQDFAWDSSAREYVTLYRGLTRVK